MNVLLEGSDRIRFIPSAGFDGNAGDITFRGWDQTAGAAGDANVDLTITGGYSAFSDQVATVSLDVVPAAGFSISVPVAQDTGFDSPITFRVADSNVVTFDDGVVGNSYVRLELSTSNGLLNVLHTSGLTFAEGTANDASRIVLYGSESRLNQALEDLTFTPNSGFYGTADISVVAEVNASVRGDYGFEDGTANDSSHFANHGTIDAGVASVDGERGNVARFDGTQSVSIPTNFNQGESLSLTTWVKFESGGDQELVSIGEGLRLTQLPEADGGLSVLFMRPAAYDGSVYQQVASNIVLPEGEWHHIAFTFDDGEQRLYVDGVAVATSSLLGSIEYSTSDTIFGADPNDAGRGFVGMLDDVQVHGSVLSAEEVASLSIDAGTVSGTLQVNVAAPPPTAVGDLADVDEGESVTIALTSNDVQTFAAIDGSSIAITSGPSHGTLIIATDGSVEYVHDGSETLADSFSYTIKDIDDRVSNVAIVDLTVTAINDVPDAHDDSFSLVEGQTHLQSVSVFNNDIDDDGPSAIGTVVDGPTSGTLNWNTDGTFEYIHDGSETTTDEFTYTIDDGNGGVGQATVLIDIVPENDAPVANDDEKVATAMSPLTISAAELLANDTDSEFDSTSILVLNQPLNGSVTVDGAGDIVYLAASGFSGVDTFTYVITDGVDVSDPATVTVTVELPPPPPSALITDSESSAESSGEDLSDDDSSSGVGGTDLTGAGGLGDEEDDVIAPPPRAESGNADVVVISRSDSDFSVDVNGSELLSNLGLVVRRLTDAAPDSPTIVIDFVAQLLQSDVPLSQSLVGYELTRAADTLGEELDSELIHDQIVVGAIVATSATLSLGGLYWALRFGYLAAGLIGSVPAWKALDPSTLAAILENDGDETIEDVLAGV